MLFSLMNFLYLGSVSWFVSWLEMFLKIEQVVDVVSNSFRYSRLRSKGKMVVSKKHEVSDRPLPWPAMVDKKAAKALVEYKYHAGQYTWLDNALNPFWIWCASWVPRCISPNMLTLFGFCIMAFGSTLICLHHIYFPEVYHVLM